MDDPDLAADLVRAAGTLAAKMLADGLETHYKTSVSDVVSAADHAAEERVLSRLIEHRPDDGVVGEEGASRPGRRTWYIDPVDGTYNFLNQIPYWCSAIGLAQDDRPVVGAVYYPAMDELWVGGPDGPTTRNAVPVAPLVDEPLDQISVCTYLHPNRFDDPDMFEPWRAVIAATATIRMLGSASIDLSGVATGRSGLFLQKNLNLWDWLPGAALVLGAGGAAEIVPHRGQNWNLAGSRQAVAEATALILAS